MIQETFEIKQRIMGLQALRGASVWRIRIRRPGGCMYGTGSCGC